MCQHDLGKLVVEVPMQKKQDIKETTTQIQSLTQSIGRPIYKHDHLACKTAYRICSLLATSRDTFCSAPAADPATPARQNWHENHPGLPNSNPIQWSIQAPLLDSKTPSSNIEYLLGVIMQHTLDVRPRVNL